MATREIQQPASPSLRVSFPGGKRVDAEWGSRVIRTDQSVAHGGNGTAPEPFDLFLASLATCAGFYVLSFCQTRGISTEGIELVQHHHFDERTHRLTRIELTLRLPPAFPERYRPAIVEAAAGCKVKKVLMDPPEVVVTARVETIDDRSSDQTRGPMVPPAVIAQ